MFVEGWRVYRCIFYFFWFIIKLHEGKENIKELDKAVVG